MAQWTPCSVSYTHLDVYKRQGHCKAFRTAVGGGLSELCRKRVIPVSYTHLDVYKRQILLWLANALEIGLKITKPESQNTGIPVT